MQGKISCTLFNIFKKNTINLYSTELSFMLSSYVALHIVHKSMCISTDSIFFTVNCVPCSFDIESIYPNFDLKKIIEL